MGTPPPPAADPLAFTPSIGGMAGVRTVLERAKLLDYEAAFDDAGYDETSFLLDCAAKAHAGDGAELAKLREHCGLKPGHLARLTAELDRMNGTPQT